MVICGRVHLLLEHGSLCYYIYVKAPGLLNCCLACMNASFCHNALLKKRVGEFHRLYNISTSDWKMYLDYVVCCGISHRSVSSVY